MSSNGGLEARLTYAVRAEQRELPLDALEVIRIGRSESNAVVLPSETVSRIHATIQRLDGGSFMLSDLGSRNGTFINGAPMTAPTYLKDGDRISIGEFDITYHGPQGRAVQEGASGGNTTRVSLNPKLISVLVTDIRGYTSLCQRVEPDRIAQMIGEFLRSSGHALHQEGAWAQKYIGDAVMAVWVHNSLAPEPLNFLPVLRGLKGVARVAANLQPRFHLPEPIRIGAGINSGYAPLGNLGSEAMADFTPLGDAVNKAFRLESATKEVPCDIAIGEATYQYLRHLPGFPRAQERMVLLKGYVDRQKIHTLSFDELERM